MNDLLNNSVVQRVLTGCVWWLARNGGNTERSDRAGVTAAAIANILDTFYVRTRACQLDVKRQR